MSSAGHSDGPAPGGTSKGSGAHPFARKSRALRAVPPPPRRGPAQPAPPSPTERSYSGSFKRQTPRQIPLPNVVSEEQAAQGWESHAVRWAGGDALHGGSAKGRGPQRRAELGRRGCSALPILTMTMFVREPQPSGTQGRGARRARGVPFASGVVTSAVRSPSLARGGDGALCPHGTQTLVPLCRQHAWTLSLRLPNVSLQTSGTSDAAC